MPIEFDVHGQVVPTLPFRGESVRETIAREVYDLQRHELALSLEYERTADPRTGAQLGAVRARLRFLRTGELPGGPMQPRHGEWY